MNSTEHTSKYDLAKIMFLGFLAGASRRVRVFPAFDPDAGLSALRDAIRFCAAEVGADPSDLVFVTDPTTAQRLAAREDARGWVRDEVGPEVFLPGGPENRNLWWGLPRSIDGVDIVVEDAVKVATRPDDAATLRYLIPPGTGYLMSMIDSDIYHFSGVPG